MLKVVPFLIFIAITIAKESSENSCDYLMGKSNIGYFDVEKVAIFSCLFVKRYN